MSSPLKNIPQLALTVLAALVCYSAMAQSDGWNTEQQVSSSDTVKTESKKPKFDYIYPGHIGMENRGSKDLSDADPCTDYCVDACSDYCSDIANQVLSDLWELNADYIDDRDIYECPWILSLELMPQAAYTPELSSPLIKPEARVNLGILGFQYRHTNIASAARSGRTHDLQFILGYGIKQGSIKIGNGVSWEGVNNTAFYEFTSGLEFHLHGHKYNPIVEYRCAFNNGNGSARRQELNIRMDYNFYNYGILHFHLSAGYLARFIKTDDDLHIIQGGLNIGLY